MTKLVVIVGFVVAFAAGLVVGVSLESRKATAAAPTTAPTTRPRGGPEGFLARELNLTPQQQEQMRQIWSEFAPGRSGREGAEDPRRQFRKERDEALISLIPVEKKDQYEAIQKKYSDQNAAMENQRRDRFDNAVNKTKAILTPEQREKYDAFLSRHRFDRGDRGDRGGRERDSRWGEDRATSRPATLP
ncbi:MAG TPA: Spy/CpxP family protein refolding chaperone [Tepidisphaeraceae bacterium]|jgi:Spy/CpxP family protein refolding chaperone